MNSLTTMCPNCSKYQMAFQPAFQKRLSDVTSIRGITEPRPYHSETCIYCNAIVQPMQLMDGSYKFVVMGLDDE